MMFKALLLVSLAAVALAGRKKYDKYDGFLNERDLIAATITGYSTYRKEAEQAFRDALDTTERANGAPVPGRQRGFLLRSNLNEAGSRRSLGTPSRVQPPSRDRIQGSYSQQQPAYPPSPYHYGFDIDDYYGAKQYRKESSDGKGTVKGSYGYTDPYGMHRHVDYVADQKGFRATIRSNEPGMGKQHPSNVAVLVEKSKIK